MGLYSCHYSSVTVRRELKNRVAVRPLWSSELHGAIDSGKISERDVKITYS